MLINTRRIPTHGSGGLINGKSKKDGGCPLPCGVVIQRVSNFGDSSMKVVQHGLKNDRIIWVIYIYICDIYIYIIRMQGYQATTPQRAWGPTGGILRSTAPRTGTTGHLFLRPM